MFEEAAAEFSINWYEHGAKFVCSDHGDHELATIGQQTQDPVTDFQTQACESGS